MTLRDDKKKLSDGGLEKAEELVERVGLSRSRDEVLADDLNYKGVL